jgi:hypothetical protein
MKAIIYRFSSSLFRPRHVAVLLAMWCLVGAGNVTRADLIIYTDSLAGGWQDASGGAAFYQNTSPVHSGSYSISVNTPNSAGLWYILDVNGINTTGYSALNFWVYAQATQLPLVVDGQNAFNAVGQVVLGSIVPDTWQQETIPLNALGIANQPDVTGLIIQNLGPTVDGATFYLDDISLISVPEPGVSLLLLGILVWLKGQQRFSRRSLNS